MNNTHEICEDIVSAIIRADCADVIDRWLCESNVMIGDRPADPAYSVFSEFYELIERLKREYHPREIRHALDQFPYKLQRGEFFLMSDERSRELKMIEYCLRSVEEKKDLETAFRKWID